MVIELEVMGDCNVFDGTVGAECSFDASKLIRVAMGTIGQVQYQGWEFTGSRASVVRMIVQLTSMGRAQTGNLGIASLSSSA
jgi:hypothetical protein